jgi:hypothetical protein
MSFPPCQPVHSKLICPRVQVGNYNILGIMNNSVRSHHRVGRVLSFSPVVGIGIPPTTHPQASVPPHPLVPREGQTRWRERGWESGRVPVPTRGHTLWHSLYICTFGKSMFIFCTTSPKIGCSCSRLPACFPWWAVYREWPDLSSRNISGIHSSTHSCIVVRRSAKNVAVLAPIGICIAQ